MMMTRTTAWFILIYGVIIATLGYIGYRDAASLASLWAGGGFGGLLVISSLVMFTGRKIGAYISLGATAVLTAVFTYRYVVTGKGLPATLAILSAAMLLFLLVRFGNWKSR